MITSTLLKPLLMSMVIGVVFSTPSLNQESQLKTAPMFEQEHVSKPLRILAVFPTHGYSHHVMTENLMLELARRGHHVTVASPFPPKEPVSNYNHVDISDIAPAIPAQVLTFEHLTHVRAMADVKGALNAFASLDGHEMCRKVYNHAGVKPLLQPPHRFDVFFSEIFGSGCCLAIGTKLQIPSIAMLTAHSYQWMEEYAGETFNPSYVENLFYTPTPNGLSSLVERLKNVYYYLIMKMAICSEFTRPDEIVIRELLGSDSPSLQEIRNNVSLFLVNTHPSIFTAKPLVPRILPVGGLHLRPPYFNKVPVEVRSWLDSAPTGVVYFSLGSLLPSNTLPEYLLKAFVDSFRELKQLQFLWKFESTPEQVRAMGIPDNVLIVKWAPQMEVLSHPNTKAFITHGGLMGTTESIYSGVPMIGMPVFAEQLINIFRYEKLGIAVRLDYRTMTKEKIVQAITKATADDRFRQKVKEVSRLFKDRPMSPLDTAVWWTEYIVRNKGAPHLESPVASMPFWKYALLDVAAVVFGSFSLVVWVVYLVVKTCLLRSKRSLQVNHRKEKEN